MLQERGKMAEVMSGTREGDGAEQKPGEYTQREDTLHSHARAGRPVEVVIGANQGLL